MAHGHHIHPFRFQERAPSSLFPALAARLVPDFTRIPIDRNVYILPIKNVTYISLNNGLKALHEVRAQAQVEKEHNRPCPVKCCGSVDRER